MKPANNLMRSDVALESIAKRLNLEDDYSLEALQAIRNSIGNAAVESYYSDPLHASDLLKLKNSSLSKDDLSLMDVAGGVADVLGLKKADIRKYVDIYSKAVEAGLTSDMLEDVERKKKVCGVRKPVDLVGGSVGCMSSNGVVQI